MLRLARRQPLRIGLRPKSTQSTAAFMARTVAYVRRGFSFGLSTAVVLGGVGVIGVTGYYLAQELLLPSSEGQLFHKAFKLVENDEKSVGILGLPLKAHGEPTNQRNVKTRPIASGRFYDGVGREHIMMQFHVDGSKKSGLVRLEVVDNRGKLDFRYVVLEVPGESRHFLVNNDRAGASKRSGGLFGIRWGPKHDKE